MTARNWRARAGATLKEHASDNRPQKELGMESKEAALAQALLARGKLEAGEQADLDRQLAWAIGAKRPRAMARRFLIAGADPNAKTTRGMDALMQAAAAGCPGLVAEALEFGADPASVDARGDTAFCMSAGGGSLACVAELAKVSDVSHKNAVGDNALALAIEGGAPLGIVDFLLSLPALKMEGAAGAAQLRRLARRSRGDHASHESVLERLAKEGLRCAAEAEAGEIDKAAKKAPEGAAKRRGL